MSAGRFELGSTTTELAVLMPVVLLSVMLVVQAGLYFHADHVVEAAAQEALEAAQAEFGAADAGVLAGESFLAEAGGVRDASVEVVRGATEVTVQVHGSAPNVVPLAVWHVSAAVSGEVERFIPEVDR